MDKNFKKNFLKGSLATTIGTVSSMGFHFISIMVITRSLSKPEFGIYALILVIVHLFTLLGGLGLELTLVRNIAAAEEDEKRKVLFPIIFLRSLQVILISFLFYFFKGMILPLFGEGIDEYAVLVIIFFTITNYKDLFSSLLQGLNYYRRFAYTQFSSAVTRVVLIVIVIYTIGLSLYSLLYIEIITALFTLILQLFLVPLKKLLKFSTSLDQIKNLFSFSFPLYLNNLLTFTYDRIHFFLIALYLTPVSIALYDVASKVPDALKRVFQSFMIVFFPNISALFSKGEIREGEKLMNRSVAVFSLIIMFGVLLSFLFSRELTVLLFSENYIESAPAFALLMLVFYFRIIANIMGYSLVSAGYSSVPVKTNIVSSIVSVGGSLIMIPVYGFIGVVYALLAMNIISQFFYHYYLKKANIQSSAGDYIKPFILAAVIYLVYILQPVSAIWMKILFLLIYPAAGYFLLPELRKLMESLNISKFRERYLIKQ